MNAVLPPSASPQKNIAVILAAGSGTRAGQSIPKQFVSVCGRQIIEYSLAAFENHENIDGIYIVCQEEFMPHVRNLAEKNACRKVLRILCGGRERRDSSYAAVRSCAEDFGISSSVDSQKYERSFPNLEAEHAAAQTEQPLVKILLHDAARPFVSKQIISGCIRALDDYQAAGTAVKTTDTIAQSDSGGRTIETILDRTLLYNFQTPQAFHLPVILSAYRAAYADAAFNPTDDCGVVRAYMPHIPVGIVNGSPLNFKITTPFDFFLAERIAEIAKNQEIHCALQ
ncbi:MAG: 2-C-methyl-D-erythritol 4-phosphate cytidylyltransferase [Bacteroides sp.]|nr:2-C-methyl-D-erythritol 4-phosphate cytidylyltransferase [Prevotella sp.]MCM1407876.1 2-C-methyl-D-erythritol 4-phosphate cytidylyltransferase [Treponema brennaborense]MCM1469618.1 2-C-methyl-D-erythritol 4-phosphate cytidylyltransferase [Bacteroides sp.]